MTTYYVDAVNGNDASNGLGPDASAVTNKPWKSLSKLLGASGMASGDTAYLSPAGPFREVVTVAMTSAVVETKVYGDPTNAQGFKTALGAAVASGPVVWTAYTTNDTTLPSTSPTLTLAGRDFLTFRDILIVGGRDGNRSCVDGSSSVDAVSCTFRRCAFHSAFAAPMMAFQNSAGTALYLTLDACTFRNHTVSSQDVNLTLARTTADYDANVLVKNCVSDGANLVLVAQTGAGAGFGGGVRLRDNTVRGPNYLVNVNNAALSSVFPVEASNNVVGSGGVCIGGSAVGQVVEDYNVLIGPTARSNVSIGPFSVSGNPPAYAALAQTGYEALWGLTGRPPLMPMSGSPLSGFGNAILATGNTPTMADDATVGTISWTNPTNASLPEGTNLAVASTIPITTGVSHYLKATAHAGFSTIPSDATIKSVRVELGVKASASTAIACSSVKLVKAGTISGNDLAASNTVQFSTTLAAQSWGNTSDPLWGLALAVTDVQAAGFGAVWAAKNTSGSTADCSVDYIRVIVAYLTADGHGGVATDLLGVTRPIPEAVGALEFSAAAASGGVSRGRAVNMGGI